ncbi:MAG: class I SAM-dependent methyltransferase [Nocardioidaceae bacterium]
MDDSLRRTRARTFSGVADVYARTRPGYPERAVSWLVPKPGSRVLELGAGTGKLTASLCEQGHDVVAADTSMPMLDRLASSLDVPTVQAAAELLPFRANSFDVVVAAQAFHWFDAERALPEIARVLRDGDELALVWNMRDESIPWARKLTEIIGSEGDDFGWLYDGPLPASPLFGPIEREDFGFWQPLDVDALQGLVRSRSYVAALPEADRQRVLDRVRELYASYERGPDGLRLRYITACFRTRVDKTALPADRIEPPGGGDLLFDFH